MFSREAASFGFAGDQRFSFDAVLAEARAVHELGLPSLWLPQQFDVDAIILAVLLAQEVPEIELGATVIPIWTHFPVHLAQMAVTADELTGGRFVLGLGLEHGWCVTDMWGLPFDQPVAMMEEYLAVVLGLVRSGRVKFEGEHYRVDTFLNRFEPRPALPVVLGALGPRMLRLAGGVADGTTTWMTGIRTVREHIVPRVRGAAATAGRPEPRVIVHLPVVVTADPAAARERVAESFGFYLQMPSYTAMLDREGASGPGDLAIVGSREHVTEQLGLLREAGATDLGAISFAKDSDELHATGDLLAEVARGAPG